VTVEDTEAPSMECPAQTTLPANAGCKAAMTDLTGMVTATDNCDTTPKVTQNLAVDSPLEMGEYDVTFTATDASGKAGTMNCDNAIKVIDNEKPSMTCPETQTILLANSEGKAEMTDLTGKVGTKDNCDPSPTVTQDPLKDTLMILGKHDVTFTEKDASGNEFISICPAAVYVNGPPECTKAFANPSDLWPPDHQFRSVLIEGVTDPNTDAKVTITVTGILQDEPVNTQGDGNTCPDAKITDTGGAEVRAERSGTNQVPGDGRVYHIKFKADDGMVGGTCNGEVTVCVPHDQGNKKTCVDGGATVDSTKCS
jgi:hypothetical protein